MQKYLFFSNEKTGTPPNIQYLLSIIYYLLSNL